MLKNLDDYLMESLQLRQVVGAWGYNSGMNFTAMTPEETNVWFFEQVFNYLRAFFGLVVPDQLEVITYNATQHIQKQKLDQQTFLDELMLIMKNLSEPIWCIRLNLNIIGFLRTKNNPDQPVRLQIQEPCTFIVWGGPDETGFQNVSVSYSLFSTTVLEGEHQELWSLNQPILEKALRKWEDQTGHMIDVVESNGDAPVSRHGFERPMAPAPVY
ncbi:MAG: hypothetical protein JNK65_06055 [Deltaproteobacteria bacterium]|nr:hypothetical protein [Deltaproteobacteria bacterium]